MASARDQSVPAGPTLDQIGSVSDHTQNFGYVRDWDHAQTLWQEYVTANNKKGRTEGAVDCRDFPPDSASQVALVGELFAAMTDYSTMKDNKRKRKDSEELADSVQVRRVRAAPNVILEIICWKILVSPQQLFIVSHLQIVSIVCRQGCPGRQPVPKRLGGS